MNDKEKNELYDIFIENISPDIDVKYRNIIFFNVLEFVRFYNFSFMRKQVLKNIVKDIINTTFFDINRSFLIDKKQT
jgi:hypothetical protein